MSPVEFNLSAWRLQTEDWTSVHRSSPGSQVMLSEVVWCSPSCALASVDSNKHVVARICKRA